MSSKGAPTARPPAGAVGGGAAILCEIGEEITVFGGDQPVAPLSGQFPGPAKTADPVNSDQHPAVRGFGGGNDAPGATDGIDLGPFADRIRLRAEGLDHADHPVGIESVLGHVQIAALENVERKPAARQQKHAGQGKDGKRRRQGPGDKVWRLADRRVHGKSTAESCFRAYTVNGCW